MDVNVEVWSTMKSAELWYWENQCMNSHCKKSRFLTHPLKGKSTQLSCRYEDICICSGNYIGAKNLPLVLTIKKKKKSPKNRFEKSNYE